MRRRRVIVGAAVAVLLLLGGVAYAFYTAAVSPGSGQATTEATTKSIGFIVAGTPTAALFPGDMTDVTVTITNPYADRGLKVTGFAGTVSTNKTGCTASDFTVSTPSALPLTLTPAQTRSNLVLANVLKLNDNAGNACQGATITVTYSVTGTTS